MNDEEESKQNDVLTSAPPPSSGGAANENQAEGAKVSGTGGGVETVVDRPSDDMKEETPGEWVGTDERASADNKEETSNDRTSWDYSHRKVLVQGVNKYDDVKKTRKLLSKWTADIEQKDGLKIEYTKVKKPPKDTWMVVTLNEEAMVQPFIDYINNNDGGITNKKGNKLYAKQPEPIERTQENRKRKSDEEPKDGNIATKRQKRTPEAIEAARRPVSDEEIKDKTTPLWRLTPEEQISSKMRELVFKCSQKIVKEIKARFRNLGREKSRKQKVELYDWLKKKERIIDIKDMLPVLSPVRNKAEFTFGYRYLFNDEKDGANDGKEQMDADINNNNNASDKVHPKVPAVGFMVTGWAGGVSKPHVCQNISSEACAIADIVERFLADSPLPPYDTKIHAGVWKLLTVRSSRRTKECMVIVQHSPVTGGAGEKEGTNYSESFESEKDRLVSMLTNEELPVHDQDPLKVTSIFFQEYDGLSAPRPEHPVQHMFGKTSLVERLGQCDFQISPGAFFQVNSGGAEILYKCVVEKVREVSQEEPENTLLFDVCCGTGTIGITCMKEGAVGSVVGVDISEPAIEDAKKNAELNGLCGNTNEKDNKLHFVAARAEDVLSKEIAKAKRTNLNFVAVVDPARDGLHANVVQTLRENTRIRRIVYVSCNPTGSLVRDAALLCSPATKRYKGPPFRIESARPVDMFPLTKHYELVMTFDRI